MFAAPDAAAQLVQLADAEPVGVHHQHDRSVGDIDANLNDRGAHQHIDLTGPESRHRSVLVVGRQPSMHERQPQLCELGGTQPGEQAFGSGRWSDAALNVGVVGLIDAGRHHIGLAAGGSSSMMRRQARSSQAGLS